MPEPGSSKTDRGRCVDRVRHQRGSAPDQQRLERIFDRIRAQYDRPLMNNAERGTFAEFMLAELLGAAFKVESDGWNAWDLRHGPSGARIQVKQSALIQAWDQRLNKNHAAPRFSIKPAKGYFPAEGRPFVEAPGHQAELYIFCLHAETDPAIADHRAFDQWQFAVAPFDELPQAKTIGRAPIAERGGWTGRGDLPDRVVACLEAVQGGEIDKRCTPPRIAGSTTEEIGRAFSGIGAKGRGRRRF